MTENARIEAAARVLYTIAKHPFTACEWDDLDVGTQEVHRERATAALAAADAVAPPTVLSAICAVCGGDARRHDSAAIEPREAALADALRRIDARRDSYAATDDPLKLFTELECMRTWARAALKEDQHGD